MVEAERKKRERLEAAMKGDEKVPYWWKGNMEEWGMEELREYERRLMELRLDVARRADQLLVEAWSSRKSFVGSSNNNSNVGSGLMQRFGGGGVKNEGGVGFSAGFGYGHGFFG